MKIEHIALYTNDLEKMKNFYENYFHAKANKKYSNLKTGLQTYFLSFEDGSRLEIMNRPEVSSSAKDPYRSGYAHIAFSVSNKEEVDQLTKRLKEEGYSVLSGPRMTGDGYYESSVLDPEQNIIEITEEKNEAVRY